MLGNLWIIHDDSQGATNHSQNLFRFVLNLPQKLLVIHGIIRSGYKMEFNLDNIEPGLAIVGVVLAFYLLKAVSNIFKTFIRPGKNLKKLGKWAVVTGATGNEFASTL